MKKYVASAEIMCMANMRGKNIKVPGPQPFSFYFSKSNGSKHGPRVNVSFDPDHLRIEDCGIQKLCDDWAFSKSKGSPHVPSKAISEMQGFFKEHLPLFQAVWDDRLEEDVLQDYLRGHIDYDEVLEELD